MASSRTPKSSLDVFIQVGRIRSSLRSKLTTAEAAPASLADGLHTHPLPRTVLTCSLLQLRLHGAAKDLARCCGLSGSCCWPGISEDFFATRSHFLQGYRSHRSAALPDLPSHRRDRSHASCDLCRRA